MATVIIKPLSDQTLTALFAQAIVGSKRGDPYIDSLRRLGRLIEAEIQAQIYAVMIGREADRDRPRRKVAGRWVIEDRHHPAIDRARKTNGSR